MSRRTLVCFSRRAKLGRLAVRSERVWAKPSTFPFPATLSAVSLTWLRVTVATIARASNGGIDQHMQRQADAPLLIPCPVCAFAASAANVHAAIAPGTVERGERAARRNLVWPASL